MYVISCSKAVVNRQCRTIVISLYANTLIRSTNFNVFQTFTRSPFIIRCAKVKSQPLPFGCATFKRKPKEKGGDGIPCFIRNVFRGVGHTSQQKRLGDFRVMALLVLGAGVFNENDCVLTSL